MDATAATLNEAIKQAKAGDTITVSGMVPLLSLANRSFDPPITITGGTFGRINLANCSGVTFTDIAVTFVPTTTTAAWDAAVRCYQCCDVTLRRATVRGGPAINGAEPTATKSDATGNVKGFPCARGVFFHQSSRVAVEDCDISQFHHGVVPSDCTDVAIVDSTIHDTRGSPITGGNSGGLNIVGNRLHTARPWRWGEATGDHGDFIHLFITNGVGQRGVRIERNTIEQRDGTAMLGINVGAPSGAGFDDVAIVDNVVCNANHQAIRVDNVRGVVANNTLVTMSEVKEPYFSPGVFVRTGSIVALANNLLGQVSVDASSVARQEGNVVITRADYAATFGDDYATLPGIAAGARIAPAPAPAPETIEITLQPGQKLIVTAAAG